MKTAACEDFFVHTIFTRLDAGRLFIKINLQTRLLIVTRLVNEPDIVNKTRPLFTLSLEMTRLVNETRLLLVPGVNSDIYGMYLCSDIKFLKFGDENGKFFLCT